MCGVTRPCILKLNTHPMRLETKYTPDEAEHIFSAVKGFCKKLASRIDEEGLPLA
jgi:hypothetical protein